MARGLPEQRRAPDDLEGLLHARGGHVQGCPECGHQQIAYNSCGNRHCPKCHGTAAARRLEAQAADLLEVPYFHVVFTLSRVLLDRSGRPGGRLRPDAGRRRGLDRGGREPAAPGCRDRRPGGVAYLGTGPGAASARPSRRAGRRPVAGWRAPDRQPPRFLPAGPGAEPGVPRQVPGRPCAPPSSAGGSASRASRVRRTWPREFDRLLSEVVRTDWVVYAKPPFGGPEVVLKYLARYTHRVAISNDRLPELEDGQVRFHWKDYAHGGRRRTMTSSAVEFVRRLLMHVLPSNFVRIRRYGILANRHRREKLALCRQLPGVARGDEGEAAELIARPGWASPVTPTRACPNCGAGRLIIIAELAAMAPSRAAAGRAVSDLRYVMTAG